MQRGGSSGIPALVLVIVALAGFGLLVYNNAQPAPALRVIVPTVVAATPEDNSWQSLLASGFGDDSTPLPTVAIPTIPFVPPTLAVDAAAGTPFSPLDVSGQASTEVAFSVGATPTQPPATPAPLATMLPVTAQYVTQPPAEWNPPPLIPPLSRDPLGRDHYWLVRPVDSNANNEGLFYYPYGSDGPENLWRIHAGLDMPNPIGEPVRAAGSGAVVWAADGLRTQAGAFQDTYSYGNVVVIRHDFGYRGLPLFTLYAHLSAVLVVAGQNVGAGDAIGLVGNTGRVTGPHVHFEVRMGDQTNLTSSEVPGYGNTYNPALWMVPYVGTGVIAGRVLDRGGDLVMDADVTVREVARGLVIDTTTTYIFRDTGVDVNPDPIWNENFVVTDVPVGRYDVIAVVNGERVVQRVTVVEGTTTFVELSLENPTPSP
jgi:murein DD-endopeptidase MepM/ murein hydrolase activator NlpD